MLNSYYFWKWADNDLAGRPVEVHDALLRGELAEYPGDIEARRGGRFRRKFVPADVTTSRFVDGKWRTETAGERQHELLCFADTLRIFEAFLRGAPRPAQYSWRNVNHLVS